MYFTELRCIQNITRICLLKVLFNINITGVKEFAFYLHNEDQFIAPNRWKIFGSTSGKIFLEDCNRTIGCHMRIDISKINHDAMNYKEQPCEEKDQKINTTQCVFNFIRFQTAIENLKSNSIPLDLNQTF